MINDQAIRKSATLPHFSHVPVNFLVVNKYWNTMNQMCWIFPFWFMIQQLQITLVWQLDKKKKLTKIFEGNWINIIIFGSFACQVFVSESLSALEMSSKVHFVLVKANKYLNTVLQVCLHTTDVGGSHSRALSELIVWKVSCLVDVCS